MNAALQTYRTQIDAIPACDEAWFPEALAKSRQGDAEASRRILGSCLRVAFQVVEDRYDPETTEDFLGLVELANNGPTRALKTFQGTSAEEFITHVKQTVVALLDRHTREP